MITKIYSSILHIHGLVGEKEAAKWLTDSQKAKIMVSVAQQMKTPAKKPTIQKVAGAGASNNNSVPQGEKKYTVRN